MKKAINILLIAMILTLAGAPVFAAGSTVTASYMATGGVFAWFWNTLASLVSMIFWTVVSLVLFFSAYYAYDFITPFDLTKELEEDQNTSIGIVLAGIFIGIAIIIAAVMKS